MLALEFVAGEHQLAYHTVVRCIADLAYFEMAQALSLDILHRVKRMQGSQMELEVAPFAFGQPVHLDTHEVPVNRL